MAQSFLKCEFLSVRGFCVSLRVFVWFVSERFVSLSVCCVCVCVRERLLGVQVNF